MLFVDPGVLAMGKRGDVVDDPNSSVLGLSAILSAFQLITSSKWAEDKIVGRDTVKAEGKSSPRLSVRTADGRIPWSTVRLHNHAGSCWMVVKNKVRAKAGQAEHGAVVSAWVLRGHPCSRSQIQTQKVQVYDVTNFVPHHPGGSAILAYGGRDASDVFAAFHASGTWSKLKEYHIGEVEVRTPGLANCNLVHACALNWCDNSIIHARGNCCAVVNERAPVGTAANGAIMIQHSSAGP
jgi:Cytochrome b5-like Heme/Steroid binding domain